MKAVILAGGEGTRLRPYTTILPKPLVPVGDRPILELIIRQLAASGFTQIYLSVGHLGELIRAFFEESSRVPEGVEISYVWEDEPLGTAGALKLIEPPTEPFLVMNGDILTTLDYGELMRFHIEREAALTIATHKRDVKLQLGVTEGEGTVVTGYVEKPTLHYEVSMGIYIYNPSTLATIPDGFFDFPDVVLALIEAGKHVCKYRFKGEWFDIGTPGDLDRAAAEYEASPDQFLVRESS
jgi:NDP-sugar pyrophosphorylase family protein